MTDTVPINARFALGLRMGPVFHTTIIKLAGGYEDRNQDWPVALWRYECECRGSVTQMQELMRHVLGRRGAVHPFPLIDPVDNELVEEVIATGDGETTEFEIAKVYADADRPYRRPLSIVSNLVVKVDGVTQTLDEDYSNEGGWIAFAVAPEEGAEITVSCDFMIPVRYEDDNVGIVLSTGSWSDAQASSQPFTLVEVHVPKPAIVAPDPPEPGETLPDGALLLSGDEQSGTDALALSGDEQSGSDVLQTSIPA